MDSIVERFVVKTFIGNSLFVHALNFNKTLLRQFFGSFKFRLDKKENSANFLSKKKSKNFNFAVLLSVHLTITAIGYDLQA